jgi:hypothetical protein
MRPNVLYDQEVHWYLDIPHASSRWWIALSGVDIEIVWDDLSLTRKCKHRVKSMLSGTGLLDPLDRGHHT